MIPKIIKTKPNRKTIVLNGYPPKDAPYPNPKESQPRNINVIPKAILIPEFI